MDITIHQAGIIIINPIIIQVIHQVIHQDIIFTIDLIRCITENIITDIIAVIMGDNYRVKCFQVPANANQFVVDNDGRC